MADPLTGGPGPAPAGPQDPAPAQPAAEPAGQGGGAPVTGLAEALTMLASTVTLVTIADGRDDIGATVSTFCPVSLSPPLVLISMIADSYPAEVLSRAGRFAVTVLAEGQRMLAGRFAVAGRPGARLLLEDVPHRRGPASGALIPDGGLAALECDITQRVPAGDHLLLIAAVLSVPYVAERGHPLVRFAGRYPSLR